MLLGGLWDVICGTGSISIALKAEQAKPADARDEDKVKELLADAKWSKWNRKACTYIHLTCDSDIRKKWGTSTTAYVRFEDQSFAARFLLQEFIWIFLDLFWHVNVTFGLNSQPKSPLNSS
jgi:hypothetical protein